MSNKIRRETPTLYSIPLSKSYNTKLIHNKNQQQTKQCQAQSICLLIKPFNPEEVLTEAISSQSLAHSDLRRSLRRDSTLINHSSESLEEEKKDLLDSRRDL